MRKFIMSLSLMIFTIFIVLICLAFYSIKQEIGVSLNKNELKKFEDLPYFADGRFYNIYKPIKGFKNASLEEIDTKISILDLFFNNKYAPENEVKTYILHREDFKTIPNNLSVFWL